MVVQVHDCALLDVASEILSEIESGMGLDSLPMPQRKPEEGTGHVSPSPREWDAPPRSLIVHESLPL